MEELDWPAQNPDLNLTEDVWDESEWRLESALLVQQHQCLTSQMCFWRKAQKVTINTPKPMWKSFPEELKLLLLQRVGKLHIKPLDSDIEIGMRLKLFQNL